MYLITIGPNSNIGLATTENGERLALTTARSVEINDKNCEKILFIPATTANDIEYITILVITAWSVTEMDGKISDNDQTIKNIKEFNGIDDGTKARMIHGSRAATLFGIEEKYAITYIVGKCDISPIRNWLERNMPVEELWDDNDWQWDYGLVVADFCDTLPAIHGEWRSFVNDDMQVLF